MGDVREGKLKAEFAHLYPGLPADDWRPAREIVEAQLARIRRVRNPMDLTRVLAERHFEFRGGQAQARPPNARQRREDAATESNDEE